MKTLMELKKKHVLLEDEASDWLQIWTAASSLDVKSNKEIKKNLLKKFFSQIRSQVNPKLIIM